MVYDHLLKKAKKDGETFPQSITEYTTWMLVNVQELQTGTSHGKDVKP